ncbi:MAG: hypothetical protein ACC628_04695, partial [Pirellulaceae bacterium]
GRGEEGSNVVQTRSDPKNIFLTPVVPCGQPYSLIGVGDMLVAGGRDEVVAYRAADGARVWRQPVEGRAYGNT